MHKVGILAVIILMAGHFRGNSQPAVNTTQPKNIIFMIGDGMGLSQITAAMYANGNKLYLEQFRHCGFIKTHSGDSVITDSAAGATAFSTGKKTFNGAIGVDMRGKPLKTILEIAEEHQLSTGMVVTCEVTHATPASFIAHQASRNMDEAIAKDFLKTPIDVLIGGGSKYFNQRTDGLNLLDSLKRKKYGVVNSIAEAKKIGQGPLVALIDTTDLITMQQGRGNYLEEAATVAINILKGNPRGFFLMIEGSQIDWGGHSNDAGYIVEETKDFDRAIGKVLEFARKDGNTLVVVTADHETGGFSIVGGNLLNTKINGGFVSKGHTGTMVPVFAFGPGAEEFMGIYENTEIFYKFFRLLGFSN